MMKKLLPTPSHKILSNLQSKPSSNTTEHHTMPPLSNIESLQFQSQALPLELKPRLDLWSIPSCPSWSLPSKKRSVRFASKDSLEQVQEIEHINDFTPQEVRASWYNKEDFERIRRSNNSVVAALETNRPLPVEECSFGLETMTLHENMACQQRIREAVRAVLEEQYDQLSFGGNIDPEYLALRYSAYSSHCKEAALRMGQQQAIAHA
jgi:hypothetical protein